MKKPRIILAAIALIVVICSCQSSSGSSNFSFGTEKTAEEIKAELKQKEQQEFYKYIHAKASMRKNIIGETVLEGTISNAATLTSFKDVVLEVTFISKTGTEIETQNQTVYEIVKPGGLVPFKIKTIASKAAKDFSFSIANATPID